MEIIIQDIKVSDLQEVMVDDPGSSHNIQVLSLDRISAHITQRVTECETHINNIQLEVDVPLPISSNEYGDQKSNMFDSHQDQCINVMRDLGLGSSDNSDLEMCVPQSHRVDIETWFSDNYRSPCTSPSLSPIEHLSHLSSYKNAFVLGDDEEYEVEGDVSDYDDYFNWEHEKPSSPRNSKESNIIFEMLGGIQNFKKQVLGSINKKYLKKSLLYLFRIKVVQKETYKYIIGFTRDLENVLETIDDTYACEWKMEILTLSESKSQNEEIKTKYELLQQNVNIDNNVYDVNNKVYNHMALNADYVNPFYTVDGDGNETYLGKKIAITEHTSDHIE
jgi:hypothetical protein